MNQEELSIRDKIDILKHAEEMQRNELASRREEENKVFPWSSTIMFVVIGALLIARPSESAIWKSYGLWGKSVATIAIGSLVFFSIMWQNRHHRCYTESAKVIARIEKLLHYYERGFFDPNEDIALFPEEWRDWGKQSVQFVHTFRPDRGGAIWFLGVLTIIMIWVA